MRTTCCIASASLLVTCLALPAPPGISFDERHRQELAANPPDLHFVLRTTNAQTRFHPGETIPVTLAFSSSTPAKYKLDAATYDRSGRLWSEEFTLDRDGAIDPLAGYFGSGVMGGITGGLRTMPALTSEPERIDLRLNDWFRFDQPGRYRLFLKSRRLTRERLPSEPGQERTLTFAAASNILEIEISPPDPHWEAARLAELRAILDATPLRDMSPEVIQARCELGYLGTPAAIPLLVALLPHNVNHLSVFGLIRSPHRASVIAELDRHIEDPDTVVSSWDIRLRTFFDFIKRYPKPLFPVSGSDSPNFEWDKMQPEAERRHKDFDAMLRDRAIRLIPAFARKSPEARSPFAHALAELAPNEVKAAGLLPPDNDGLSRGELIAKFGALPAERQSELLAAKWPLVRGPEMLPALRRIIQSAQPDALASSTAVALWHGPTNLAEHALHRLTELAPDDGKHLLIDDIARPEPRFASMAIKILPAQDVPKADPAFAARLESNLSATLPLAAKFATHALIEPMRLSYRNGDWPCAEETWFVAYFVRVDAAEGKRVLARALAGRDQRACFQSLLGGLSNIVWNRVIEQQAIATLNDPDGQAAADAALALAAHSGLDIEPFLWRRLEQWSKHWRGSARDLDPHPITGADPHRGGRSLGEALFGAISRAQAWIVDAARARRLADLCIDDRCRKTWENYEIGLVRLTAAAPLYRRMFQVAGYSFTTLDEAKAKIAQYPSGTAFQWCRPRPDDGFPPEELDGIANQLAQLTEKLQVRLELCAAPADSDRVP